MAGETRPIAAAIAAYHRASWAVLNDARVWRVEAESEGDKLLAWPRPADGTQFNRLLSVLFNAAVNVCLVLLRERDDPASPAWPPDVRDPKMQALLRVVQMSMAAGEKAIVRDFGGFELNGKRDFNNNVVEALTEVALQAARDLSLTRDEAFELVGLPVARQAYRARKRTVTRR